MPRKKQSKSAKHAPAPVGRPRFGREALSELMPFRCTPSQRGAIRQESQAMGLSEADVIRRALDYYFDASPKARRAPDSGS